MIILNIAILICVITVLVIFNTVVIYFTGDDLFLELKENIGCHNIPTTSEIRIDNRDITLYDLLPINIDFTWNNVIIGLSAFCVSFFWVSWDNSFLTKLLFSLLTIPFGKIYLVYVGIRYILMKDTLYRI